MISYVNNRKRSPQAATDNACSRNKCAIAANRSHRCRLFSQSMAAFVLSKKGISDKKDTIESSQAIADATKKDDALPPTGESPVVVDPALTRCEPVKNAINHLKQLLKCGPGGTIVWVFLTGGGSAKADSAPWKAKTATNGETTQKDPAEVSQLELRQRMRTPRRLKANWKHRSMVLRPTLRTRTNCN